MGELAPYHVVLKLSHVKNMTNWSKKTKSTLLLEGLLENTRFVLRMLQRLIVWFQKNPQVINLTFVRNAVMGMRTRNALTLADLLLAQPTVASAKDLKTNVVILVIQFLPHLTLVTFAAVRIKELSRDARKDYALKKKLQ